MPFKSWQSHIALPIRCLIRFYHSFFSPQKDLCLRPDYCSEHQGEYGHFNLLPFGR